MENQPNTENVVYLDEYRKAKWLSDLKRARDTGQVALFGQELTEPAQLLLFPAREDGPDGAA